MITSRVMISDRKEFQTAFALLNTGRLRRLRAVFWPDSAA